ncbi:MAG: twin-arginine translocation signal domain-containing protein, partial [Gemmatimonadetes bacterium]|nr:twin-arginine translocation signal domain-containing protein [Gemmatimonadota bacterium]
MRDDRDATATRAAGLDRRDFLKTGALGVAAGALTGCGEPGSGEGALARSATVPQALATPPDHPLA